jgi:hypothetical protein
MPPGAPSVYGVIDPAREPALYEHVARLEPHDAQCLYQGRLDPQVARCCPHLVLLDPADPLSRLWRTEGWGKNWGMLIVSSADFRTVWRRLRHFTQVKLPDGQGPMLFRFWDPRVFRLYMPLVDADVLPQWFEDIDRYIVESEDGRGAIRYGLRGGALSVQAVASPSAG